MPMSLDFPMFFVVAVLLPGIVPGVVRVGSGVAAFQQPRCAARRVTAPKKQGGIPPPTTMATMMGRKPTEREQEIDGTAETDEGIVDGAAGAGERETRFTQTDAAANDAESFLLEYSIDSFLRGEYDRTYAEDAASPLPGLSPRDTVDAALRSLRALDDPEPSHGAAVFSRFCVELGRGERWGIAPAAAHGREWRELVRGALTPTMLARRLRASEGFSGLLDWNGLRVAETGVGSDENENNNENNEEAAQAVFGNDHRACIDATLSFETGERAPPSTEVFRFELVKMLGGVWLIDAVRSLSTAKTTRKPPRDRSGAPPAPGKRSLGNKRGPPVSNPKPSPGRRKRDGRRKPGGRNGRDASDKGKPN